jgi:hypothetical protein
LGFNLTVAICKIRKFVLMVRKHGERASHPSTKPTIRERQKATDIVSHDMIPSSLVAA